MERCSMEGCFGPTRAKGLCKRHYDAASKANKRGGHLKVGDFCRKGHKIEGENVQTYLNHGIQRIRCAQCNRVKPNGRIKLGDICIYGHKIEGSNAHWIKSQNGGDDVLRCKTCTNARKARYLEANKDNKEFQERARESRRNSKARRMQKNREERYEKILEVEVTRSSGGYTGLNYLRMTKAAERVWEPLHNMFDKARSFCYQNPTNYIDYEEEDTPSKNHAFQLCNGCPMLVECGRFANVYKPVVGVWAGEVWKDGKVMYK